MSIYPAHVIAEAYATPIGAAVQPLRAVAADKAEQMARERIAKVYADLAAKGWDAQALAPYPNSFKMGRNQYLAAKRYYDMVRRLTKVDPAAPVTRRFGDPEPRIASPDAEAKAVADAREMAEAQYDAFVCKLNSKVGEHTTAVLKGNHVWGESFLTVTTPAGEQVWKTHEIWNVSKLGLHFPQWPTRQVKARG